MHFAGSGQFTHALAVVSHCCPAGHETQTPRLVSQIGVAGGHWAIVDPGEVDLQP